MYIRRITTGAAAAALALLATACSDQLTAPAAHPSELALTTSSAWSPTLISNSVRYRDTGGKPATGRSGSATLQALALLGRDGATSLELRAGRVDGAEGAADLVHVQVKALGASGMEKFTTNHHDGLDAPLPLAGLSRGDALQVQAAVRGIDAHRTDVVAVTESVKLRPDLEVTLSAPGTVSPGVPVNITAVVAEKNGDLGATTSCRLAVDGVVVDQAQGIWVDAGDAVSCAFTHRFSQPGSYTLTVSTGATVPGDWDESNNAASAPVQVAAAGVTLPHFAMVEHKVGYRHSFATYRQFYQGQPSSELVADDTAHEDLQMVQMNGSVFGLVIPGPVTVEVSQATGGQTVHSARMTAESMHGMWCASTGQGPIMFYSCSQAFGTFRFTHFNYQRNAGTVTYHSVVYSRTWFEGQMQENVYHSHGGSSNFQPLALGDRFQMSVRITAADGTTYNADADLPLTEQVQEGGTPESCNTQDWGGGRLYETCNRTSFRYRVVSGRNR